MADTIEIQGASDEVDRFAQLWRDATPEEDGDIGLLRAPVAQRALVIHAERV